jgi:uncharacterized protein YciW
MSNPFEKASPMSDQLLKDALDSNNRSKLEQREQITAAKQVAPDKEIFDITKLGEFYSTRGDNGEVLATPEVVEEYEAEYYLKYPEVKSLQEYAARRTELDGQAAG